MIKNLYTIDGDTAILHITRRNGDKFNVLMDKEDLDILDKNDYMVHVSWAKNAKTYYAEIAKRYTGEDGKRKGVTIMLHGVIMNKVHKDNKTHKVDHINTNKLDNRKENLRIIESQDNSKNRKSKNSNNKSGYRNVCWNKGYKMWSVQLQVEGKNKTLGLFDDVHEAGRYAEKMRQVYYGEFAGES